MAFLGKKKTQFFRTPLSGTRDFMTKFVYTTTTMRPYSRSAPLQLSALLLPRDCGSCWVHEIGSRPRPQDSRQRQRSHGLRPRQRSVTLGSTLVSANDSKM